MRRRGREGLARDSLEASSPPARGLRRERATKLGRSLAFAAAFLALPLSATAAEDAKGNPGPGAVAAAGSPGSDEREASEQATSEPSSRNGRASPALTGSRSGVVPSAADRAAAQALFDEGRELMEQARSSDACPRFEESDRLEPALGTRFHLANCYEELGKLASAHALYLEVASEAATRNQVARERVARERAQAVEPRLARLAIEVPFSPSPALRVERDGTLIGAAQWGLPVPVDPGVHHVTASAPGREMWAADVEIPGEPGITRVNVPPLAERRRPFFAPLSRKLGLAALGVGAGAIGLGTVFAVQAISKKNASDRAGCSDRDCQNERGLSLRREALRAGDRATWAMGLGVVGLGAAAALFWIWATPEDGDDTNGVELSPSADLRSASLRLNGRF